VDIPLEGETVKLHTLVIYPTGTAKTGVVLVMQHGVGVDEWQRALADQVAQDGFIAVLPDLWSGTGPNGGNYEANEFIDDAVRNAAGKGNGDESIKEKALFSLSQQNEPRAQQILRDFALRESESGDLREKAIFWLGQRRSSENTEFLRNLYHQIKDEDLREKILFSLSQQRGAGNEQWLMNIALDPKEDIELRKKALFWAGQSGIATSEVSGLYNRMGDSEMKEQIIFVLSQRQSDRAAMDKLFDIAKNEKDAELRKKAIFWLGQSRDPRVQQFLMDLINR